MARKLDRSDDQERLLSSDGDPPPDRSPLSRRSYLGIGATTVAGLTVTGASAGSLRRHGIAFERTLDAVEDLGMDPTGGDAVDRALQQAADGTLVQFPDGEHQFGPGDVTLGADSVGFERIGETVSFVAPETGSILFEGTDIYLAGVTLDMAEQASSAGIRLRGDRIVIQDLDGAQPSVDPRRTADSGDPSAGSDSLVVHGSGTNYEITVDGRIKAEKQLPGYTPSGTNAEGVVDADADRYTINGRITDLRLEGAEAVSLNGRQIDPSQFGSGFPNEFVFTPTGPESHCRLSVTELSPWGRPDDGGAVTISDPVAGKGYRFDGAVKSLSGQGTVTLSFGTLGRS